MVNLKTLQQRDSKSCVQRNIIITNNIMAYKKKKEVVQTQLLILSFKHDSIKVVQIQLKEELFKHNFYHRHSKMTQYKLFRHN